jgi:hypothetical protein
MFLAVSSFFIKRDQLEKLNRIRREYLQDMMEFDIDQKKYPKREENRIENHKINGMRNLEKIVLGTFDEGGGRPRP